MSGRALSGACVSGAALAAARARRVSREEAGCASVERGASVTGAVPPRGGSVFDVL